MVEAKPFYPSVKRQLDAVGAIEERKQLRSCIYPAHPQGPHSGYRPEGSFRWRGATISQRKHSERWR
jgi:hypothetical protein